MPAHLVDGENRLGSLHEVDALLIRAKIQLAREGADTALDNVERALGVARSVGAPQLLFPVLAFDAHARGEAGQGHAASEAADELLALWLEEGGGTSLASFWLPDLAFALTRLDRRDELLEALSRVRTQTRWLEAAIQAGNGDWPAAAGLFARIGSLPDEAFARLRAAAELEAAEFADEADRERRQANAFYRDVGAASGVSAVD